VLSSFPSINLICSLYSVLTSMEKCEATRVFATDAIMYPPDAAISSTHTIKSNGRGDRIENGMR
jgi:hypothetical protein